MHKTLLFLLLLLMMGVGVLRAQDDMPQEREIITVLKMADDIFESGIWSASAAENLSSTTATFQSTFESGFSGLSFINYLHFDQGYTPEELEAFFDDTWFEESFINWEDVRKTNVCFDGDVTLHEFDLAFRDAGDNVARYGLRYWVEPLSETRVRAWHIAVATSYAGGTSNPDGEAMLDDYATRIYPDLPSCPR